MPKERLLTLEEHARVLRIVDGNSQPVIVDFPLDVYGKGPQYRIGPLGLAFAGKNVLVVGGGGQPDGATGRQGAPPAIHRRMAHPAGAKGDVLPPTGNLGTLYWCHSG